MGIGFLPSGLRRHPVYGSGSRKLGYIEQNGGLIWFQDTDGKRVARILCWNIDIPEIGSSLNGGTVNPASDDRWEE